MSTNENGGPGNNNGEERPEAPEQNGGDPNDNIAVSFRDMKAIVKGMTKEFTEAIAALESRNDQTIRQIIGETTFAQNKRLEEHASAINQLSDAMRVLAEQKGRERTDKRADLASELIDMFRPVIQEKITGERSDPETQQINALTALRWKGTLRAVVQEENRAVQKLLRKGLVDVDEAEAAGVVLDQAVNKHARI